jgi:pyridoxine 4-dehydrogenase
MTAREQCSVRLVAGAVGPREHRDMDKTFTIGGDMKVSRLGFGAMRITGPGIWGWPSDVETAKLLLRRALDIGVNLIDTADAYGPEISEYLIAGALSPYPEDLVVATKGGLVRGGPREWIPDGRPAHLRRAVENSLRRLGRERIDLYQLHTIDDEVPLEDSLGAIVQMQEAGKIRHIGVSNFRVEHLERARKVAEIVTVQNRYSLADRKHEAVVDTCTDHGIGFIPWYPLATGDLADDPRLRQIAANYEATPGQIALAWLLKRSPVMLPIPGTSSIEHLEENTRARDLELSDDDFEALSKAAA